MVESSDGQQSENLGTGTLTRTLFAGPFLGEFGWELFCWQGYLRRLSDSYDKVIVSARPGHEALYEDFAQEFIPLTPPSGHMPDGNKMRGVSFERYQKMVPRGAEWITPLDAKESWEGGCPHVDNQRFIRFGKYTSTPKHHILIHARDRSWDATKDRNWPREKWLELVSMLPSDWSVGWIGTKEEAMSFGSNDLRDLPLKELIREVSKSQLVIGPSSGPMHLASLCGIPHIVWSGNARDVSRYARVWNPFGVKHSMIRTWQPEVASVLDNIKEFLPLLDGR